MDRQRRTSGWPFWSRGKATGLRRNAQGVPCVGALRHYCRDDKGAALVEFAIVTPVFLLMLSGVIVWGYSLSLTSAMYDAARQGARQLSVGAGTEASVEASMATFLANWPQSFTFNAQDTASTGTDDVIVTITTANVLGDMFTLVPSMGGLTAVVTMRKEAL